MIKKEAKGTYKVTFSTRNKRGKKVKREKSGVKSLALAKRLEHEFIAELKGQQEGFDYAGKKFESFLFNHYLPYCEEMFTDAIYLQRSVHKWCQSLYPVKLEAVTPNDIAAILKDAKDSLSYGSLKKLKSYLSRIFIHACNGGLSKNPVATVKIPKPKDGSKIFWKSVAFIQSCIKLSHKKPVKRISSGFIPKTISIISRR